MKLKFQSWLDSQNFSNTVDQIFSEAVVCYKAEAYRASMVISYIGFLTILKERLLVAAVPNGITPTHWGGLLQEIQDDEKWDAKVRDATQQRNPASIFIISEDLRHQIIFWKNRRNDCAHFKSTRIDHYHIESFWRFLEDNLSKLVVNGSFAALKNKIQNHFDISLTPAGQDFSHLVSEIETAINRPDLQNFFSEVHVVFSSFSIPNSREEVAFFNEIFRTSIAPIKTALATFIKTNNTLLLDFLRVKPERLPDLSLDPSRVRNLWFSTLFTTGQNDLNIYAGLLQNGLIPSAEITEANKIVLERINWNCKPNDPIEYKQLLDNHFFVLLEKELYDEGQLSQFDYCNPKANLIASHIENSPLTKEIVTKLSSTFNSRFNPRDLRDTLNKMFTDNQTKKTEFIAIATDNAIALPSELGSLK